MHRGTQGYTQSAEGQFRELGEIVLGDLMDETPRTPREEDRDRWATTLGMANRISSANTQTLLTRMSVLSAERDLIRQLPEQFADLLDRPKTRYTQELTAEISSMRPLVGIFLGLSRDSPERIEKLMQVTLESGEIEALTQLSK